MAPSFHRHLAWAPGLLSVVSLLCFQTVIEANSFCTFNKTVGESVQLPLKSPLDPDILKIEWIWNYKNGQKHIVFGKPNGPNPQWYELEDKYKQRFNLTKEFFLNIKDLTTEMSAVYTAQITFKSGDSKNEVFRLCVYGSSHWSIWIGLAAVVLLLVILGVGTWIWRRKKMGKAMPVSAVASQAIPTEDTADPQDARLANPELFYAEINLLHPKDSDGSSSHGHRPKDTHVMYSEVQKLQP